MEASLPVSREALRLRLDRNTKRGKRHALSLQGVVYREVSQVSRDDRFAAIWFWGQLWVR